MTFCEKMMILLYLIGRMSSYMIANPPPKSKLLLADAMNAIDLRRNNNCRGEGFEAFARI